MVVLTVFIFHCVYTPNSEDDELGLFIPWFLAIYCGFFRTSIVKIVSTRYQVNILHIFATILYTREQ